MRLEGTLDAFGLPDILQLLAFTRKTGALRLSAPPAAGVVRVRDGAISAASSDSSRQVLARRVVGAGLVGDDALAAVVGRVTPEKGVVRLLVADGVLSEQAVLPLAAEQATDAVGELLRWTGGEFSFVVDDADPDALPLSLPVADVVAEGQRRLEVWAELTAVIPSTDVALALAVAPPGDAIEPLSCTREEWGLLAVVDGTRTVADVVTLLGRSEFAVMHALAGLVSRGLLVVPGSGPGGGFTEIARRQALLAGLEGGAQTPAAPAVPAPRVEAAAPVPPAVPAQLGAQHEPADLPPADLPAAPVPAPPVPAAPAPTTPAPTVAVPSTAGANALAPDYDPPAVPVVDARPSLSIAGGATDAPVVRRLLLQLAPRV